MDKTLSCLREVAIFLRTSTSLAWSMDHIEGSNQIEFRIRGKRCDVFQLELNICQPPWGYGQIAGEFIKLELVFSESGMAHSDGDT